MIEFQPLRTGDQSRLMDLMRRIYPPAYAHFWPDGGEWYVEQQYGRQNFLRELREAHADYRFIQWNDQTVGILRLVHQRASPDHPGVAAAKLHRLYLAREVQGQGIGKRVIAWAIARTRESGERLLWLEAMTGAPAALGFYERVGFTRAATYTLDMPLMYAELRGMCRMEQWLTGT
ncbi:GNAT family N-acetyltransferase [Lewinella sp. JB7]|uniref:GNAT family N-acetyltransferase n=1 Tax=Lewinella sp. JB7 TaxID=2962887 RepID=UPI0020C982F1|nr:GNAT family N-acetyltransferase [Lewinella sp. JB7]MCP9236668.1 GNAT family N-acetyltransferase [Lewinella sp. JB7]